MHLSFAPMTQPVPVSEVSSLSALLGDSEDMLVDSASFGITE